VKHEIRESLGGVIIVALFAVMALGQCNRRTTYRGTACGPLRPVTIGGSMVIGCR
jgi:hypothetical protein